MNSRWLLAGVCLLALCSTAGAVGVPVEFVIDPAVSNLEIDVSVSLGLTVSDSDSTPISGSIEALVDLGTAAPLPPTAGLSFTGGHMVADQTLDLSFFIIFLVDVDVVIDNVTTMLQTPGPMGAMALVGPADYEFDLAQHELVVDQGTLTASGTALGDPVDEFYDFAAEPFAGSPDPGMFSGTLALQETASDATSRSFHAELLVPIDATDVIPLDEAGTIEATVTLTGSVFGTADFTAPLGPPGDYNGNGTVDAADYAFWRDTLGSTSYLLADGSGNSVVDAADYDLWEAHFGETSGGGATAGSSSTAFTAVPEPTSSLILLLAGVTLAARPPRRQ